MSLAIMYIGESVTCGIDYLFTPNTENILSNAWTSSHPFIWIIGKLHICTSFDHMNLLFLP